MMVHTALQQGARLLEDAGIAVPRLTAEVLLAHAMCVERVYFFAHPEQEMGAGLETWATEISPPAALVAADNAARLGAPVNFVVCDLMDAVAADSMDLIVSNPPYVPLAQREGLQREVRDFEPHVALFAGRTGFELYDRIVAGAPRVLKPGGWLIMELGFTSLGHVQALLAGWDALRVVPDLAGIPRVIAARR